MPEVEWKHQLPDNTLSKIYNGGTNYTGVFTLENGLKGYKSSNYTSGVCHKPFNTIIQNLKQKPDFADVTKYMWLAISYNSRLTHSFDLQAKWIEFNLDPKTSPWRMMLPLFEYSVTRDKEGRPTGLIMPIPDINTVALFHWFKGFRGLLETRAIPFLHAINNGVKDNELLYKLFVMSSYTMQNYSNPKETLLHIGGEHAAFKRKLNKNVLNANMVCNFNQHKLLSSGYYYGSAAMGEVTFGQGEISSSKAASWYQIKAKELQSQKLNNRGFFLKYTNVEYGQTPVNLEKFIENIDELWEYLS